MNNLKNQLGNWALNQSKCHFLQIWGLQVLLLLNPETFELGVSFCWMLCAFCFGRI